MTTKIAFLNQNKRIQGEQPEPLASSPVFISIASLIKIPTVHQMVASAVKPVVLTWTLFSISLMSGCLGLISKVFF